jgi:hypothetical protein
MPFDWSIKIRGTPGKPAQFVPQGGNLGDPLHVKRNDTVSWGNETDDAHQPWPTDPQHNLLSVPPEPLLSNSIPPQQSSSPTWVVAGPSNTTTTIFYRCKLHPEVEEFGTIVIHDP